MKYWGRVLEGYLHWLLRVLIAPLLIIVIFATGAWVQDYQDWSWKSVLPLWALFILSIAGLRYLRPHGDDSGDV